MVERFKLFLNRLVLQLRELQHRAQLVYLALHPLVVDVSARLLTFALLGPDLYQAS